MSLEEIRQRERLDLGARGVLDVGEQARVEREVGKLLVGELDYVVGRAARRRAGGDGRGKDGRRRRVSRLVGHAERRLLLLVLLLPRRTSLGLRRAGRWREDAVRRPGRATGSSSTPSSSTTTTTTTTATTATATASTAAASAAAGGEVVGVEHG